MIGTAAIEVREILPGDARALAELFEACASPCFCRFWHFEGVNNAWLDRCANERGTNREELERAVESGSNEARGVVALAGPSIVGWMKLAPRSVMQKMYDRRLYRNLPCFEGDQTGVFVVGCFLIHPVHRRRGLASELVAFAARTAPAWGARALEAFPRRSKEPVSDEELWTGSVSPFTKNGFVEVNAFEPYPVLRLDLSRGA